MAIDAVIFDCDGTLVDSEPLAFEAIAAEAGSIGLALTAEKDRDLFNGQSMAGCLQAIEQRFGTRLPPGFEARMRRRMAALFRERLQPMPGALQLLQRLGVPCCVASNGPLEKIELTLQITGLLPFFGGRIFSAVEVGSFKPEPGLFLHAARALGAVPARCAVVEDSVAGVRAGLAAGMLVHALRSPQPLPPHLAARVRMLESLDELNMAPWNRQPPSGAGRNH
jgi:HAD superfamily hydrolase (TIGR01509 family)